MNIKVNSRTLGRGLAVAAAAAAVGLAGAAWPEAGAAPKGSKAPAKEAAKRPTTRVSVPEGREVATIAAGCFWSMEAIYQEVKGVERVEPGYAGGHVERPAYEQVSTGRTGHAEAIQITFDPKVVSYSDLLRVLLITRDPTTLNRQGADEGANYRSAIFFHSPRQKNAAREEMRKVGESGVWKDPIVTEVQPFSNFYRAEDYHVNYYRRHPDIPYSRAVIVPKLAEFRAKFKPLLKP